MNRIRRLLKDIESKGFYHLLSANIIIQFLGFGSVLLVAKFLAPVQLGQIKVMQSYIAVAAIIAGFGFNVTVLKLCSEKRSLEEKSYIFIKNCLYSTYFTAVTMVLLFLLSYLGLLSKDHEINKWFRLYMIIIPAQVYTLMIMVYFQALKKIQLMSKAQVLIRLFGFMGVVLGTYYYGLIGFLLCSTAVAYIALIPLIKVLKKNIAINGRISGVFAQSFFLLSTA